MPRRGRDVRVVRSKKLTEAEIAALHGAMLFDPDDLDEAIVAVRLTDAGAIAVYDYHALCDRFYDDSGDGTYEDAQEHVDYNLVRALPYMGERAPVIGQVVRRLIKGEYSEESKALDLEEWGEETEIFSVGNTVYARL